MWDVFLLLCAVAAVLFVFTVIVFVHELGHFLVARRCGVYVETFSIGFGPEIFGWNDKYGTRWRFSLLPVGGYVKFLGDDDIASKPDFEEKKQLSEELKKQTLEGKNVWRRMAIVLAGPVANFLFSFVIFACFFFFFGTLSGTLSVTEVIPDGPAEKAGFKVGDLLLKVNDSPIESSGDILRAVQLSPDQPLQFVVERENKKQILSVSPVSYVDKTELGMQRVVRIGIRMKMDEDSVRYQSYGFLDAVEASVVQCWTILETNVRVISLVIKRKLKPDTISSSIRGAEAIGRIGMKLDIFQLISITAMISLWLGAMNLLPIPVLDGGHLMFYIIEAVRGRPLSKRIQELAFGIGASVIISLIILVHVMDTVFIVIHQ